MTKVTAVWYFCLTRALGGYHGERRARVGMQLFHDAADIVLDRAFGQEKRVGNLPVAHTLGDEPQNLSPSVPRRPRQPTARDGLDSEGSVL